MNISNYIHRISPYDLAQYQKAEALRKQEEEEAELQELLREVEVSAPSFPVTKLVFHGKQPSVFFAGENGIPYRGQEHVKRRLNMMISGLPKGERMKVLLVGGAGSGKTSLAWIIAKRIQDRRLKLGEKPGRFFEILPAQFPKKKDLDLFMKQLQSNDIVFIDEVHLLTYNVGAEPLYHTLDDTGVPRYPLGDGKGWIDIPTSVSWIAATTEPGQLDGTTGGALRRRLSPELRLDPPGTDVLTEILMDQDMPIFMDAAGLIAERSGKLPWQALLIYRAAKDMARYRGKSAISKEIVVETLETIGVDKDGLTEEDRSVIFVLMQSPYRTRFGEVSYRMSEAALCAATGIDRNSYKEIVQPKLMRLGLLTTVGGQTLTDKAVRKFHAYRNP
jgi:Holliday junction resolvasome RuvABC ATP-dependent DNA helicase subunit